MTETEGQATNDPVRLAALDVGSNTIRLLIADVGQQRMEQVDDLSRFVRLGKDVDANGELQPDRIAAALQAISELAAHARGERVEEIRAIATSAVRDAPNGPEFARKVRKETGVDLRILSGDEEAALTALGATAGLRLDGAVLVCDLGGGSAELIALEGGQTAWARSLQLGSGRLTERFIRTDPPNQDEVVELSSHVRSTLQNLPAANPGMAVLTGGTATQIGVIAGQDAASAMLSDQDLDRVLRKVTTMPSSEIVRAYGVEQERSQVLPAGVIALDTMVHYYGVRRVLITHRGIREGVLMNAVSGSV